VNLAKGAAAVIDVIVAEPNVVLRTGFKAVLERHEGIAVAAEALTADQFRKAFLGVPHHVVIVEMDLLKSIGSVGMWELRRARPASRILVHSYEKDPGFGAEAFKFGVTGYVANDCSSTDLCAAVTSVAAGQPFITASLGDDLAKAVCFRATNHAHASLNKRELQVFKMLDIGLDERSVAKQMGKSLASIEAYRKQIMAKMEVPGCSELTRHAISQTLSRKAMSAPTF
jgi:DNA-binding NarL/FixJ family response regulator